MAIKPVQLIIIMEEALYGKVKAPQLDRDEPIMKCSGLLECPLPLHSSLVLTLALHFFFGYDTTPLAVQVLKFNWNSMPLTTISHWKNGGFFIVIVTLAIRFAYSKKMMLSPNGLKTCCN